MQPPGALQHINERTDAPAQDKQNACTEAHMREREQKASPADSQKFLSSGRRKLSQVTAREGRKRFVIFLHLAYEV